MMLNYVLANFSSMKNAHSLLELGFGISPKEFTIKYIQNLWMLRYPYFQNYTRYCPYAKISEYLLGIRYLMKKKCSFVMGFCRKDLNKRKSCKRISKIFNLQRILQITIRDHMG
ncbi:hypothetical protein Anas_13770 [Armadillidium nasatum]|uniref:Uncharacterized protein n=1 Tax=Armadillidium nasatum TaxID=96803 RepID=A0A5N5TG75_9CRUS|nr:hypothetical protein Anas_13770 [Armadillidium nasatum]